MKTEATVSAGDTFSLQTHEDKTFAENNRSAVSICIPAFNECNNLKHLIPFIERQNFDKYILKEIIVDISGSTDCSKDLLSTLSKVDERVHVIDIQIRDGLINSFRRLILTASGDAVVRIDADVTLNEETLNSLLNEMSEANIGIAGPRIVPKFDNKSFVNTLSRVSYNIHHLLSMRHPKTTNLQVFRNIDLTIPQDAEVEDILLQSIIESKGYKARYVPTAIVNVSPPYNLFEYMKQSIRNIRIQRWFKLYSGKNSPTQNIPWVGGAILDFLKEKTNGFGILELSSFIVIESICFFYVRIIEKIIGQVQYRPWDHVNGTKRTYWDIEENAKN